MIGETVGNFRIVRQLGKGGMGEVWLAEHKEIATPVAIKMLLPHISVERAHVQRFFNEAVAVSKTKHAGIAKIFDVGFRDSGQAYLVMEFLDGEPLSKRIARLGRLPVSELCEIARQIAGVLEATHAEQITHRDLKPDNVYIVRDAEHASGERVKILDFGIAKLGQHSLATTNTNGGSMGTPAYMSPEQWKSSARVDHRADIYSLGCLVFEMACGRVPFPAQTIGEACQMHLQEPPPALRSLVPDLPKSLEDLVLAMLAKSPDQRPALKAARVAFAAIATSSPVPERAMAETLPLTSDPPSTFDGTAKTTPPPTRNGGGSKAAIGVGVAALAGAGLYFGVIRKSDTSPKQAAAPADAVIADAAPPVAAPLRELNPFVKIDPVDPPVVLGLPPAQKVGIGMRRDTFVSPRAAYSIQTHEVSWEEVESWLATHPDAILSGSLPPWARDKATRAKLPVVGFTWGAARDYCKSLGGRLPTEAMWEFAARGRELRPNPWGTQSLDFAVTLIYAPGKVPNAVGTSEQDRTPEGIRDLAGNVQEWTQDEWLEDRAEQGGSRQDPLASTRAVRGLPFIGDMPKQLQKTSTTYRESLCATGDCVARTKSLLGAVGFRCVRE